MTEVYGSGPWTIPRSASRSFEGTDGEIFRRVMLLTAATLQSQPRPSGRGCFFCQIRSQKALRKALVRGEEDPSIIWLSESDVPGDAAKRVIAAYDVNKKFALYMHAPEHGFVALVPLHAPIHDVDGKLISPVRVTNDYGVDNIVSNMFKVCAMCSKKPATLFRCQKCKCVVYCDKGCQKAHWPKHKQVCT